MASGDFDSWSNERIRDELLARGQVVGPVIETTRNIYLTKLKKLVTEIEKNEKSNSEATVDNTSNDSPMKTINMVRELDSIRENNDDISQDIVQNADATTRSNNALNSNSPQASPKLDDDKESNEGSDDDGYYGEETSRYITVSDPRYTQTFWNTSHTNTSTRVTPTGNRLRMTWITRCFVLLTALIATMYFYAAKYPKSSSEPEEEL